MNSSVKTMSTVKTLDDYCEKLMLFTVSSVLSVHFKALIRNLAQSGAVDFKTRPEKPIFSLPFIDYSLISHFAKDGKAKVRQQSAKDALMYIDFLISEGFFKLTGPKFAKEYDREMYALLKTMSILDMVLITQSTKLALLAQNELGIDTVRIDNSGYFSPFKTESGNNAVSTEPDGSEMLRNFFESLKL